MDKIVPANLSNKMSTEMNLAFKLVINHIFFKSRGLRVLTHLLFLTQKEVSTLGSSMLRILMELVISLVTML